VKRHFFVVTWFLCLFSYAFGINVNELESNLSKNYSFERPSAEGINLAITELEKANAAYLPRFTLTQNARSANYSTVSLEVSVSGNWNILDYKRILQSRIVDLQLRFARLEQSLEKAAVLHSLRQYVQALDAYEFNIISLRRLENDVQKQRPLWQPSTPAKQFAPNEIESYLRFLELIDIRKSLEVQADRLRKQISKWTKIDVSEVSEGKIEFPGDLTLSVPVQVAACVETSTAVQRASLRLEQEKVYEELRNDASPVLTLNGQVAVTTTPATGQSAFSGQVALTLSIPLPPNIPVTGGGQVSVTPGGATQTATISYPNQSRQADPRGVYWAEKNLADIREAVTDDLKETLRSRENLILSIQLAKQRLEWGERSLRDTANGDEIAKLNARFALMGLKVRGAYDHLNLQLNTLTLANTCQIEFTYVPRDTAFNAPKDGGS
jgi:hypothetical protein